MQYLFVGGSHGIGFEVIKSLAEKNHEIKVFSRTAGQLVSLPQVEHFEYDIESEKQEFPELTELHGLVYLPGTINLKPFPSLKKEEYLHDLTVNFLGVLPFLQQYLELLKKGKGSCIMMSTVAVQVGMSFHASVAAAKGAVEGFVRSMAAEYAPDIRFNAVAPSLTETSLGAHLLDNEQKKEAAAKRHPLKRFGKKEDIAAMIEFLLGPGSEWISGQVMHVDGGISALRML